MVGLEVMLSLTILFVTNTEGLLSNVTRRSVYDLPEIQEGQPCVAGKRYRIDCNACHCTGKALVCTKMACLNTAEKELFTKKREKNHKLREEEGVPIKMIGRKRSGLLSNKCVPGKVYKKGCSKCFCDHNRTYQCSKQSTLCNENIRKPIATSSHLYNDIPNNVRPPISDEEFAELSSLPTESNECEPGRTYKVECNACVCLYNKNLMCDKALCFSYFDDQRKKADIFNGKPCKKEVINKKDCIQCVCDQGKLYCEPISGCIAENHQESFKQRLTNKSYRNLLSLDMKKGQCIPYAVYKEDCNTCHCTPDGLLRCTQRMCLKFTQARELKLRREQLIKDGQ